MSIRIYPSIKRDAVNPSDFLKYDFQFACEQCSHFNFEKKNCSLGYLVKNHLKEELIKMYLLSGKMTFCRFHEID
ncbi:MAG TPA: hypothetical protein PLJ21_06995 [Pseudobdellovibrionaceae bacterium]|nr:hypothetical protein [Pseudobdellovibrionaceae bacterium]